MKADTEPGLDLVVVGGGPAGLAAAKEVASVGGRVAVLDENQGMGGKLRGQLHEVGPGEWWKGWEVAAAATAEARSAGARLVNDAVVWGLEPGWAVRVKHLRSGQEPPIYRSRSVLVATGAVEKAMPIPGWTLPGVVTIGAAQVFTNVHRVTPGRRVLVVGVDVLSITIARSLALAGVDVIGIVRPPNSVHGGGLPHTRRQLHPATRLAPRRYMRWGGKLLQSPRGLALASRFMPGTLKVWGLPLRLRSVCTEIVGSEAVTGARVARTRSDGTVLEGTEEVIEVDAVCLANGLMPLNELAAPLGCGFVHTPDLGGPVPLHGEDLRTTLEGLYVAGNAVGVESAEIAMLQGELAGNAIIRDLGLAEISGDQVSACVSNLKRYRAQHEFQFYPNVQKGHDVVSAAWDSKEAFNSE